ncbi:MAG TPA: sensor histidine kinase [Candidatus Binatia bacterium]|nr:sensor histidine kinase [Candidatus Binatia bacterium]
MSFLPRQWPNPFLRFLANSVPFFKVYLLPILAVFFATQVNWLIAPYLTVLPPFLMFLAAVMLTTWYGGFRAALFAIVLSALTLDYFFIGQIYSFALRPGDAGTLGVFVLEAIGMAYCIDYLRRNEERLRQANADLHDQVASEQQRLAEREQKVHGLTTQLALTEERERRQLAAELHDYLAQLLALARMKVKQTQQCLYSSTQRSNQFLGETDALLGKSLEYIRTLMAELYPVQLSELGLPAAILWLAKQMPRHGLEVDVSVECDHLLLSDDHAMLLYQSVRELVMNIVKHAAVRQAFISLEVISDELLITVRDTGRGFDPSSLRLDAAGDRFGLSSVRDRMVSIGGKFFLESASGRGTTVTLSMPLQQFSQSPPVRVASSARPNRVLSKPTVPPNQESLSLEITGGFSIPYTGNQHD